jgi:hypothetical protein
MSDLGKSIIRGAGHTIGRNLVNNGLPKLVTPSQIINQQKQVTSSRRGRPAKSSFEKALEFNIGGRPSTVLGKMFNLVQEFEQSISKSDGIHNWVAVGTLFNAWKTKHNDAAEYLKFKNAPEYDKAYEIAEIGENALEQAVGRIYTNLMNIDYLNVTSQHINQIDNVVTCARQFDSIQVDSDEHINVLKELAVERKAELDKAEADRIAKAVHSANASTYVYYVVLGFGLMIAFFKALAS